MSHSGEQTQMERMVIEYLTNAFWQLPLLATGAWLLLRTIKPEPVVQHRVWLAVLGLALVLPLRGAVDRPEEIKRAAAGVVVVQQVVPSSIDPFSANAFDAVGQPGGLVLGHQTSGAWPNFSSLAFASRVREVQFNATAVHWVVGVYLAVLFIGLVRLARAWHGAWRLATESREISLTDREQAAVADSARRMDVKVPQVRELHASEPPGIAGPVVVGAIKPVLLWEGNFAADLFARERGDELMAALCHEMAHIRRHDYLMNLLCEAAALPLKWHPATYAIEGRIRTTREMVCDAMAAEAIESEAKYANCLLSLAQRMVVAGGKTERATGSVAAVGLFSNNVLEERVMRLMRAKTSMSMPAKATRALAGGLVMTAAVVLAAIFHVVPAAAQAEPAAAQTTTTAPSSPQTATDGQSAVPETAGPAPAPAVPSAAPTVSPAPVPPAPSIAPPAAVAPAAPTEPDVQAPQAAPAPVPNVAPLAPLAPIPPESHRTECKDHEMSAFVNGHWRKLTPEEKRKVDQQLAEAQKKIAKATAKLNSPEFRKQMENAQREAMEAERKLNSGEFQKQMADAQRQIAEATAKLNSPEFRKQMENAQREAIEAERKLNSGEFQKQMADAQRQIAEATAKLNSAEFRQQIEKAQRDAMEAEKQVNSAEFQKQMADAQKQIADALAKMKAEQSDTEQK